MKLFFFVLIPFMHFSYASSIFISKCSIQDSLYKSGVSLQINYLISHNYVHNFVPWNTLTPFGNISTFKISGGYYRHLMIFRQHFQVAGDLGYIPLGGTFGNDKERIIWHNLGVELGLHFYLSRKFSVGFKPSYLYTLKINQPPIEAKKHNVILGIEANYHINSSYSMGLYYGKSKSLHFVFGKQFDRSEEFWKIYGVHIKYHFK